MERPVEEAETIQMRGIRQDCIQIYGTTNFKAAYARYSDHIFVWMAENSCSASEVAVFAVTSLVEEFWDSDLMDVFHRLDNESGKDNGMTYEGAGDDDMRGQDEMRFELLLVAIAIEIDEPTIVKRVLH